MFCLFLICECGLQTQHPNQNEFTPKPSFVPQSSFSPFGEFEMSEHNIIVAKKYINIFRTKKKNPRVFKQKAKTKERKTNLKAKKKS